MISKRPYVASIIALSLLAFLTIALLINIYEVSYHTLLKPQSLWRPCNGEEICSATNNKVAPLDGSTLQKYYDEMIKTGLGRRNGTRMDISLLSAFEHPEQIYVMMTSENRHGDTVYCRYFDHQQIEIRPSFKTVVYPEFTANCVRREGAKYISLTEHDDSSYEFPMPIIDRTRNAITHYLSACLAPIYGTEPKWLLLAEFIEHHKIQGVTHFFIYVKDIDEYSRKLLDDYVLTGEVDVIALHDRYTRDTWRWQFTARQDCLIRTRHHSRWVAIMDLDERLITTDYKGTLSDFLQKISDPTIAAVSLRQRWVLRNETMPEKFIDKNQVAEFMPTWRYHNTSHVGKPGQVAKYIVDPKKAISLEVHFVEKFFNGYTTYYMKPEEAVIRHYRDVDAGEWGSHWLKILRDNGEFSMTDYPEAHMKTLRENVQRRLHHVYGGKH